MSEWAAKIAAAVEPGVTERPPVAGFSYVAFAVHPRQPGRPIVLAIAHRDGEMLVLDAIRERIGVEDAAHLVKQYGIDSITGAPDEGGDDSLAHAACGALLLAKKVAA
jgi:hypothetical protein